MCRASWDRSVGLCLCKGDFPKLWGNISRKDEAANQLQDPNAAKRGRSSWRERTTQRKVIRVIGLIIPNWLSTNVFSQSRCLIRLKESQWRNPVFLHASFLTGSLWRTFVLAHLHSSSEPPRPCTAKKISRNFHDGSGWFMVVKIYLGAGWENGPPAKNVVQKRPFWSKGILVVKDTKFFSFTH